MLLSVLQATHIECNSLNDFYIQLRFTGVDLVNVLEELKCVEFKVIYDSHSELH